MHVVTPATGFEPTSYRVDDYGGEIVLLTMHAEVSLNGQILKITSVM